LVQTALNTLMRGRTALVIAHRLATIKEADLIIVLKDGEIIERGTHDTLVQSGGEYGKLVLMQGIS
jgi:ABC-type multidrug transport system fused ATPase/permease subunit